MFLLYTYISAKLQFSHVPFKTSLLHIYPYTLTCPSLQIFSNTKLNATKNWLTLNLRPFL